jgi:predicted dehydrogenase
MASVTILRSGLLKAAPNDKPNIAAVGVGGKGWEDINQTSKGGAAQVVAFCDVDQGGGRGGKRAGTGFSGAAEKWPDAKRYTDWREMLDKEGKRLNGVTVSTPDHMHAPVTMTALQMGIATYTQKPLTRTVHEARQLTLAARKAKVVTQMGNQAHSGVHYRTLVQLIQGGAIGRVKEAHTWSNRPIWDTQGVDRPEGSSPMPENLNWDLWLGVAPYRPYIEKVYHPFAWRGWFDFGAGALGDMGCHIIDPVVWALELSAPTRVSHDGPSPKPETFPKAETITYEFPATKYTTGPIRMLWYDGKRLPAAELAPLPAGEKLPLNGSLFIGEKGVLLCEHGGRVGPRLLPAEKFADYPVPKLEEVDHYLQWTNAIRGEGQTTSNFDYAGPLTETVLLGTIACRFPSETLEWDSANLRFTNVSKANAYVRQPYRKGWEVAGLS